jgi:PEP-CTERM motif
MNLTFAQFLTKSPRRSASRLSRTILITLCVLFLSAVPALADTVRIGQVVQTLSSSKGAPEIKLSSLVSQDPVAPGTKGTPQSGPRADAQGDTRTDSIISGVTVTSEPQIGVDITEEGEVEGTICDCGEIFIAGASFPKWPFLFLGVVPLVFISDCDDCDKESSTPTPTPPPLSTPTPTPAPPEVPEPASLLLFGSGLVAVGAGLRRRYAKSKLGAQMKGQGEE